MFAPILATKLYAPRPRPKIVLRPRLIERLNAALHGKLTLISAPAGFGKTTLVGEWVAGSERPVAWLSLDKRDNDSSRFLAYLVASLQTLTLSNVEGFKVTIGENALALLQSPQPSSTESILTVLINEITSIQDYFILILDDYHIIDTQPVDNALAFLLEHLPPQMHMVIATREDPPLPLARLRVRGQLTELRANDLRFTHAEAAGFLNQVMDLNLSANHITALETRTEGWIAGLQLAALSMQGQIDTDNFINSFTGSHYFVLDYLLEEVLQQQPEVVQIFLLYTSILDRLCGSLCDAVLQEGSGQLSTPPASGQETLEYLEQANLFIIPLDNERRWFRYHHLFTDLLKHHLHQTFADQIPKLHQRASKWYEQNDLPSAAIHHAFAAEDFNRAADLAELAWPAMSGSFQSIEWLSWVKALPDEFIRARPVLSVSYAWAFLNSGNPQAAGVRLLDAELWLQPAATANEPLQDPSAGMIVVDEEQFNSLPTSLATARAYHAQAIGDTSAAVHYARQVLDLLPEGDHKWRGDATALLGLAYWTNGDLKAAHKTLSDGLAVMGSLDVIIGTFVLADMKMGLGHLQGALRSCEHALQLASEHGEPLPLGTEDVYTAISALHRELGDLEASAHDLMTSRKLGEKVELPDWQHRWCIAQARLKETLGDLDVALNFLDEAERMYVRTPLPDVRPITALRARVWVAQGRLIEALVWARKHDLSFDDDLSYMREFEHITLARVLIAQYRIEGVSGFVERANLTLRKLIAPLSPANRVYRLRQTSPATAHSVGSGLLSFLPAAPILDSIYSRT